MGWQDRHYHRDPPSYGGGGFGPRGLSMVAWLLVINCVVFLIDGILAGSLRGAAAAPSRIGAFSVDRAVYSVQLWRWITYQFVHAHLWHLVFNMIVLYFFGRLMEQWWGSRRFLAFYLLCGTCGAVLFTIIVLLVPGLIVSSSVNATRIPMVGASGSIFGILVGCAVVYPHQRVMLLIPPVPMTIRNLALVLLGITSLSLLVGATNAGGEAAHLGGAALGFFLIKNPSLLNWANVRIQLASGSGPRARNKGRGDRKQKQVQRESNEVDRILAKVKDHGVHSLTHGEKKTLQRATDRQREAG